MAELIVAGPIIDLIKFSWNRIRVRFSHLIHSRNKFDALKIKLEELQNKRDDIICELEAAQRQGKTPTNQVKGSLDGVQALEREVEIMEQNRRHLGGFCPDCLSLYRLGKNSAKKLQQVEEMMEKLQNPCKLVATPPPEPVEEMIATSLGNQTRSRQTIQFILNYLQDEQIGTIGIYGMGGVGKTTLLQHVNNQLPRGLFDYVIWVIVSRNSDLRNIQNQIAERLRLTLPDTPHDEQTAKHIFARLRKAKYMLILDDVWEELNLDKLGIPRINKDGYGCKIALTTRSLALCNAMSVDINIHVGLLPSDEAWDLFREKAGDIILSRSIEPIARLVAEECGGLPLAITAVGKAMRDKSTQHLWQNALRALREASPSEIQGMEHRVFQCLKFSYENLEDKNLQSCFLYCCLFPQSYRVYIDELVVSWIAEGLVEDSDNLQESIYKGHGMVEKLKDACLLQTDYRHKSLIKMHDLIFDLGRWIASSHVEGPKFLIKNNMGLTKTPQEEEWREVERISLIGNNIEIIPEKPPECPKLQTLFLSLNQNLRIIPSSFFEQMYGLRVLILQYTGISSLPPSLCYLWNLRYLNLFGCRNLEEIPPLGELHQLQMLILAETGIRELPQGLEGLGKLKILSLNHTSKLKKIGTNELGRLTCLEQLFMVNGTFWGRESCHAWTIVDLQSVACLKELKILHITIEDARTLEWFMGSILVDCTEFLDVSCQENIQGIWFSGVNNLNSLKNLELSFCSKMEKMVTCENSKGTCFEQLKDLKLFELPQLYRIWEGPRPYASFGNLEELHIYKCNKLKYVFARDILQNLQNLTTIHVGNCIEMEMLIEGQVEEGDALRRLEVLILFKLPKLWALCKGILSLPCLEETTVDDCPMLKELSVGGLVQRV